MTADHDSVVVDHDDNGDHKGGGCDGDGTVCRRLDEGGDGEFPLRFNFQMKSSVTQSVLLSYLYVSGTKHIQKSQQQQKVQNHFIKH